MLNSESERRSNERLKSLHRRKKKYERLRSNPVEQKQSEDWYIVQQENRERFRNFLDNLGDVAYEADASGNVTYANKMAEKITGMPSKDIIGRPFLPLFTKESQQKAIDVYERTLNGESTEYELTFTNGRTCHFKNKPLNDENGKIIGVFGVARDVTKRKQVEKALRESEERFKNLFNNALLGLYRTTPDGRILMANPAIVRMLGYDSFEELANRNLEEQGFEPGYSRSEFKERIEAAGRVIGLEADWVRRDGTILSIRESAKAIRDEHGNILYYEGTVEDITERKRAEDELKRHRDHLEEMVATRTSELEQKNKALQTEIAERKRTEEALRMSELRFRSLIEQTTDAVFCYEYNPPIPTDLPLEQQVRLLYDGILVECNDICAKSYGAEKAEDVIGKRLAELFRTSLGSLDELFTEMIKGGYRTVDGEGVQRFEDGTVRYYLNNGHGVIEDGKLIRVWGTFRDITERKQAEEELRIREQKLRALLNAPTESAILADTDGTILDINRIAAQRLGKSVENLIGMGIYDYLSANIAEYRKSQGDKVVSSGKPVRFQDEREGRNYDTNIYPVFDNEGKVSLLAIFSGDITERKQAEKALKESESRFRELVENMREVFWMENADGTELLYVSPAYEQVWGRSCQSFYENPQQWIESIHPEDRQRVVEAFCQFRETGEYSEEFRIIRPDGTIRWIWDRGVLIRNESDEVIHAAGVAEDITERKQAEEALRESEEKFRSLAEQSPNMIFINKKGRVVYANKKCEEIMGYKREELCSEDFDFRTLIAPESAGLIHDNFVRHQRGEDVEPYDYGLINKNGDRIEAINASKLIQYEGQTAILGVVTDITDRKKAEEALRESEQKYSSFVRNFMGIAYRSNIGTWTPLFFHGAVEEITGYREGEFLAGKPRWDEVVHPDDLCWMTVGSNSEKLRSEPNFSFKREYRIIRKDGQIRWVLEMLRNLTDELGKPSIVEGYIYDITERKKAEQALRDSEERLKVLFESAPDAIYLIDSEGRIVDGNRAALKLIGFAKEEVIGKTLAETGLLSGEQLSKAEANLKKVATGKLSGPNKYDLKRKDGTHVSIEVRTFPVKIEGKMLTLGIARDITEHKRAEKELLEQQSKLKSLASQLSLTEERERYRLATDLHDQISQSLVISKIKLDQLRKFSTSDELNEPLKDVSNCLGQIIDDTRALTFDLSYPILYELGFETAVAEWLTDHIQEKRGIKTEFEDDGQHKPLDDDIRVLLFRNVRELLINVIKHAEANKVRVSIRKENEYINVEVEDNGVGFDPVEVTLMAAKRAEFGLFSIRERLEQLGGMIEIDSEPGSGSKITMRAPLKISNSTDRISK